MSRESWIVASACLTLVLAAGAQASVPVPTVSGPITGGTTGAPFLISTFFSVAPFGYVEEEFFLSGTATGYTNTGTLGSDGKWPAAPSGSADYTTRILVRRPAAGRRFNGTVIVEWLNVSAGFDTAPDWTFAHTLLMREGFAWVGVSAQAVGINGGGGIGLDLSLKTVDPVRYAPLVHPGDSFSYDMFSQVGEALRASTGVRPLGELRAKRLIAVGESQSAFRLVTYVNAIHPLAGIYDGFLIHSRAAGGTPLSEAPQATVEVPTPALIRDDVDVPVLAFETETDLVTLDYFSARQPDGPNFRLWEVAGTAHADTYQTSVGQTDQGRAAADTTHLPLTNEVAGGIITCDQPINAGPQHYVVSAALAQLERWVRTGRPANNAPRLDVIGPPAEILLDEHGNAVGGIRTPQVDVPVATLSGLGQTGSAFCVLFGTTAAFDPATLAALYPSHADYVAAVRRATKVAVHAGVVLRVDSKAIIKSAIDSAP